MDWFAWIVGPIMGAVAGLLVQNIAFPSLYERTQRWRRSRFYGAANRAWKAVQDRHIDLHLLQAGWDEYRYFPMGRVTLQLEGTFELRDDSLVKLREEHRPMWLSQNKTDDVQVGVSSRSIVPVRLSDNPDDERPGRTHHLRLEMHEFRYFDYLATHRLRLDGTAEEKKILNTVVGQPRPEIPVAAFPNACSVGVSLFCEDGDYLVLPRRSM